MNKIDLRLAVSISTIVILLMVSGNFYVEQNHNVLQENNFPLQSVVSGDKTVTPIKHVINIYFENHAFDNFFGVYPSKGNSRALVPDNLSIPVNLLQNSSIPSGLSEVPVGYFNTSDPNEGYVPYHLEWNHGKMNGFSTYGGKASMTYYGVSQMAPEWDIAEEYALADNYFTSILSESNPNHMYYIAGYSPVFDDYGPPPFLPFSETIFGELQHYNISWGLYVENISITTLEWEFLSGKSQYSNHFTDWNEFVSQLNSNSLPSVSYLFSQGGLDSQGPPDNILNGEIWLTNAINLIENSPIWNSTAIFVTYDEAGGFYDHVPPPVFDGVQTGFRVPLIVISPFAKENYISNTLLTTTSLLSFIDYNWNIPALNQMVLKSNIPLDMFNFQYQYGKQGVGRYSITFSLGNSLSNESGLYFTPVDQSKLYNLSSLFPATLQYQFSVLPYNRTGSLNYTLQTSGNSVFVSNDISLTPIYESSAVMAGLALLIVLSSAFIVLRRRWTSERTI